MKRLDFVAIDDGNGCLAALAEQVVAGGQRVLRAVFVGTDAECRAELVRRYGVQKGDTFQILSGDDLQRDWRRGHEH